MRLLLTSNGLSDPGIVDALVALHGRNLSSARIAFVPTAANAEPGDKQWLVDDLHRFRRLRPECLDLVDLAALDRETATRRLSDAEMLVFGGGDTYHLMSWVERHDLRDTLSALLQERVYVGISAGSIATGPHLGISSESSLWRDLGDSGGLGEMGGTEDPWRPGLGYVDFCFRPHLGSPHFPTSQEHVLAMAAPRFDRPVYAVDDRAAIVVDGDEVTPVGSGRVVSYNA